MSDEAKDPMSKKVWIPWIMHFIGANLGCLERYDSKFCGTIQFGWESTATMILATIYSFTKEIILQFKKWDGLYDLKKVKLEARDRIWK